MNQQEAPVPTAVIGCGQLGELFARREIQEQPGTPLLCTVRRQGSLARLDGLPVRTEVVDLLSPEAWTGLLHGQLRVLVAVAPGRDAGGDAVWTEGITNLVAGLDPEAHVVHVSSTGVYAESDGGEVAEESALAGTPRALALLHAERALLARKAPTTILRCSGLIGPGRGPHRMLERFAGTSRAGGDGWLNLVWMDDVVEVIRWAFRGARSGVFNCSGATLRRRDFYDPLLARAGLPAVDWQELPRERGRRVNSDRLEAGLGSKLRGVDPGEL